MYIGNTIVCGLLAGSVHPDVFALTGAKRGAAYLGFFDFFENFSKKSLENLEVTRKMILSLSLSLSLGLHASIYASLLNLQRVSRRFFPGLFSFIQKNHRIRSIPPPLLCGRSGHHTFRRYAEHGYVMSVCRRDCLRPCLPSPQR